MQQQWIHRFCLRCGAFAAGSHGEGSHVIHAHHDGPYSVSYTETMQQPLSPMVIGPNSLEQQQKDHTHMASHLNMHAESAVH